MRTRFNLLLLTVLATVGGLRAQEMTRLVADMSSAAPLNLKKGKAKVVPAGPLGRKVVRIEGGFSGRIDLKPLGIDPKQYDLIKMEVKSDRGAFVRVSLENYPNPGELSHWYVLDNSRGSFEWRTIWIDLALPEEIKPPGRYKGMAAKDPDLHGMPIMGSVKDLTRSIQGQGRRLWLGNIRFVKKAIDLDWDQSKAPYTWAPGQDLIFTYPLEVANLLDRPVRAVLSLLPFSVAHAQGALGAEYVDLGPKEKRIVPARIVLPSTVAERKEWLYCERFEARARVEDIPDSEVTVLRSSDPVHLPVVVPIPEDKLDLPMTPSRKLLPADITKYDQALATSILAAAKPTDLDQALTEGAGFGTKPGGRFIQGVNSAAFLYHFTGDKQYLKRCEEFLARLVELYPVYYEKWRQQPVRPISTGIVAGNILQFNFKFGGTQRYPYQYSYDANSRGGVCSGIVNSFDMISADMDPKLRQAFMDKVLEPGAIVSRNHYFGIGNQQSTSNYTILYAGMACRNWPLAAFAYSSEHGLLGNINWTFDDDGLCLEGHYQAYTISPTLWSMELLYGRGIDLYDRRFHTIVHSKSLPYQYQHFTRFIDENRFAGKPFLTNLGPKTDGDHLNTRTFMRWDGMEVQMNWGTHIMRSNRDRCTLSIKGKGLTIGGHTYSHSTLGHSVVIVNEGLQNTEKGKPLSHDVTGPVQHIMVDASHQFPDSKQIRTFALIGPAVLAVDRVECDKPGIVDWCLQKAGALTSLAMAEKEGSFTDKAGDTGDQVTYGAELNGYHYAKTDDDWNEGGGRMSMLGAKDTELYVYDFGLLKKNLTGNKRANTMLRQVAGKKNRQSPYLMVRRRNVKRTDFVALFSKPPGAIERVPVTKAGGQPANAVGVKITLDAGKSFHAVVSYEPADAQVTCGPLKTKARFATGYE